MTLTPEQKAEGWIEHDGGPCPVPRYQRVSIILRDGTRHRDIEAGFRAGAQWWTHTGNDRYSHIIAYRPEPKP